MDFMHQLVRGKDMLLKYVTFQTSCCVHQMSLCMSLLNTSSQRETQTLLTFYHSQIQNLLWTIKICLLELNLACFVASLWSAGVWQRCQQWFVWRDRGSFVQEMLGGQLCSWPRPNVLSIRPTRDSLTFKCCTEVFLLKMEGMVAW